MATNKSQLGLRVSAAIILSVFKASVYFLSYVGPVLLLYRFRFLHPAVLLALAIVGVGVAGCIFLSLLVLTKRALIGPLDHTGVQTIGSAYMNRWFAASMLIGISNASPFRPMTSGISLFASRFYRGMGARMPDSVFLSNRARVSDPWFAEFGENVNVGAEAVILGHLGHGREIVLGRVRIGDRTVIGMRAVIFPNVQIGSDARVAAGAIVTSGTTIPEGETWGGVPARKLVSRTN